MRMIFDAAMVAIFCTVLAAQNCQAASWSVAASNTVALDTSSVGFTVSEMSGVTYVGPSPVVGRHRFLTVQDDGTGVVTFDATFDLTGNLVSAVALSQLALSPGLDHEGIVEVGETIFVSDEDGPGVRQYDPTTGNQLQSVTIPAVFSNDRNNRGFESLAYDELTSTLWTANEEALTVDGPSATQSLGTTVRLLEITFNGNTVTAGQQFAYEVEPLHGIAVSGARSGLADLASMPDGSLLALERSAAAAFPQLLNRIYEVNFDAATDISTAQYANGLLGETFTPIGKELLWSGGVGGGLSGANMEGLTVGPSLPNGDWLMLGVVDNGGSGANTIASFIASPTVPLPFGPSSADFDADGSADGDDLLAWQRGVGVATLAGPDHGDANHDGTVTAADLAIWQTQYGTANAFPSNVVPEPSSLAMVVASAVLVSGLAASCRRRCAAKNRG